MKNHLSFLLTSITNLVHWCALTATKKCTNLDKFINYVGKQHKDNLYKSGNVSCCIDKIIRQNIHFLFIIPKSLQEPKISNKKLIKTFSQNTTRFWKTLIVRKKISLKIAAKIIHFLYSTYKQFVGRFYLDPILETYRKMFTLKPTKLHLYDLADKI